MKGIDIEFEDLFRKVAFQDDEQAFKVLFLEFYPALCVFAMRYVTQEETARDIVQNVFFKIWEKRKRMSNFYTSQEEVYTLKELETSIGNALTKLPPNVREAFELNRFKGMTYMAIAEKMEVSPKTIESYISRALKFLRVELGEYFSFLLLLKVFLFFRNC